MILLWIGMSIAALWLLARWLTHAFIAFDPDEKENE